MKTRYALGLAAFSAVAGAGLGQQLQAQVKPRAYVIGEAEITDPATFKNYQDGTATAVPQAGGRFIVGNGRTFVINGAPPQRFSVIEWSSFEEAQAFYESDVYNNLVPDRDKGAKLRAFLVEGRPAQ